MSGPDAIRLHLHLPPEVTAALHDQDIDLVRLLIDEGHDVERAALPDPTMPAAGAKDAGRSADRLASFPPARLACRDDALEGVAWHLGAERGDDVGVGGAQRGRHLR